MQTKLRGLSRVEEARKVAGTGGGRKASQTRREAEREGAESIAILYPEYSLRRAGERSARNNQHRHGLPRAEIDLYSGWDLYEHSRDMQLHYAGQDRQHRIKRCDITRWI